MSSTTLFPSLRESLEDSYLFLDSSLLKEEVGEAALRAGDANRENLALWIEKQGEDRKNILLFRWQQVLAEIRANPDTLSFYEVIKKHSIGSILLDVPLVTLSIGGEPVHQISTSAAESGWGPLMYDIALGASYPGWVVSDRGSVSRHALRVWSHYLTKRPDVEKKLLFSEKGFLNGDYIGWSNIMGKVFPSNAEIPKSNEVNLRQCIFLYSKLEDDLSILLEDAHDGGDGINPTETKAIMQDIERKLRGWNDDSRQPPQSAITLSSAERLPSSKEIKSIQLRLRKQMIALLKSSPLAWAYRLRAPSSSQAAPALAKILDNTKSFKKALASKTKPARPKNPMDQAEISRNLRFGAEDYFRQKYINREVEDDYDTHKPL